MSSNIFRNELFQIGGYRLLERFWWSQSVLSQYAIGTAEYRYLIGENSYFNVFFGWRMGKRMPVRAKTELYFTSREVGAGFRNKSGIVQPGMGGGSRNDIPFNLRQSKNTFRVYQLFLALHRYFCKNTMTRAESIADLKKYRVWAFPLPMTCIILVFETWKTWKGSVLKGFTICQTGYAGLVQDRCLLYVFRCAVYFANSAEMKRESEN